MGRHTTPPCLEEGGTGRVQASQLQSSNWEPQLLDATWTHPVTSPRSWLWRPRPPRAHARVVKETSSMWDSMHPGLGVRRQLGEAGRKTHSPR